MSERMLQKAWKNRLGKIVPGLLGLVSLCAMVIVSPTLEPIDASTQICWIEAGTVVESESGNIGVETTTPVLSPAATVAPTITRLPTPTPFPTETPRPECDRSDPNSLCQGTIIVRAFLDLQCNTVYDDIDFPLPDTLVTFVSPTGQRTRRVTNRTGYLSFPNINILPDEEVIVFVEFPVEYRGQVIRPCPHSGDTRRLQPDDFNTSRTARVEFRAVWAASSATPTTALTHSPTAPATPALTASPSTTFTPALTASPSETPSGSPASTPTLTKTPMVASLTYPSLALKNYQ